MDWRRVLAIGCEVFKIEQNDITTHGANAACISHRHVVGGDQMPKLLGIPGTSANQLSNTTGLYGHAALATVGVAKLVRQQMHRRGAIAAHTAPAA
eukprot:8235106-Lingulodinium_polyedra.AAC.1